MADSSFLVLSGSAQGTFYKIKYKGNYDYQHGIDSILHVIDMSMSSYLDSSLVSKVNRNEDILLDIHFKSVFRRAAEISLLSKGAFDISVAPLVNYWGFGPHARDTFDSISFLDLKRYVGMDKVRVVDGEIVKDFPELKLDFNSIAQGYTVDVIGSYFESLHVDHYLINVGGEIKAKGLNDKGNIWVVGVESPVEEVFENRYEVAVDVNNMALATSGSYRKYKIIDGIKYSHTIDPRIGKPVAHSLLSVSVLADNCMDADGLATLFMVLGLDSSKMLLDSMKNIEAYFIYENEDKEWERYETYNFRKKSPPSDTSLLE
ncbi:MAG: FAD:protein FMN transferase [Flavobacteriales bacterium]|nr:FAD:protein FMN transferase [Flavobacteriales bacterium]